MSTSEKLTTKERILAAALHLYNEQGTDVVTIRHIAKEINISHGNLQYHYKNTEEIILALFNQLAEAMDKGMAQAENPAIPTFAQFLADTEHLFSILYQYRFFFLHFVATTQRVPEIKKRYNAIESNREHQFIRLFNNYQETGILRTDIPEEVWKDLVTQIFIVGNFWMPHNEIQLHLKGQKAIKHYVKLVGNMFYPYLTTKGIATIQSA
ncbi:MAG: TetR/AcrR family transcriptional regulator [Chitinophaga sp.]|uniref:TetR/AcrR family transcriptional regulator n=1 Tax=Chitinophaga sp. TaxID=1869181 RepID=UPI0025BCBC63|nr:TetR/AcrR family transcriptional regulator [Chitinophaga sp.]MBV8255949.1 TetR/AcrR family transcriptional regulator [Chitinophaga sp.]